MRLRDFERGYEIQRICVSLIVVKSLSRQLAGKGRSEPEAIEPKRQRGEEEEEEGKNLPKAISLSIRFRALCLESEREKGRNR